MAQLTQSVGTGSGGVGTSKVYITVEMFGDSMQSTLVHLPPIMSNANSPCAIETKNLSSGNNTITVPSTSGGFVFYPPDGNTATLTFKGITSGDTGISWGLEGTQVITFDASPDASIIINASATVTGCRFVWF